MSKIFSGLVIIILILLVGLQNGKIFGWAPFEKKLPISTEITLQKIQIIFPDASDFKKVDDRFVVQNKNGEQKGWAICSTQEALNIRGFCNAIPLLIGFDQNNKIAGVAILDNCETPSYLKQVINAGLLESWNEKTAIQAYSTNVDATSGATESSNAIIKTMQLTLGSINPNNHVAVDDSRIPFRYLIMILLLSLAVWQYYVKKVRRFRLIALTLNAIVFGFIFAAMLSAASIRSLIIYGVSGKSTLFLLCLLLLSIALPLFTRRTFYCHYVCPFGAMQEIVAKISPFKVRQSKSLRLMGLEIREWVFFMVLFLSITGLISDFTLIEPFTAFSIKLASWLSLALAILFLIAGLFLKSPWCTYGCTTGQLLQYAKPTRKQKENSIHRGMKNSTVISIVLGCALIYMLITRKSNVEVQTKPPLEISKSVTANGKKISLGAKTIVFPMPALVIGTYDSIGNPNIMTCAWAGICNSKPPSIAISLREATYSYANILATKAFTVNVPSADYIREVDYVGIYSGRDENKFKSLHLTPVKSEFVNAPYVDEFPVVLECKLISYKKLGLHTQFIGEILDVKIDPSCKDKDGVFNMSKINPIIYGIDSYYSVGGKIGKPFSIGRK